jgi:hypothetical protein
MPAWLVRDDAAGYHAQLAHVRRYWPQHDPPLWPDYFLLLGEASLTLYEGKPEVGFELVSSQGKTYGRGTVTTASSMANIRFAACLAACASSALASPSTGSAEQRARWCEAVDASERVLEQDGSPSGRGLLQLLRSARDLRLGDTASGLVALRRAIEQLDDAELGMQAAATRVRLGQRIGSDAGELLVRVGSAAMLSQGVCDVDRMTELLCPGLRVA